ncbi:MAG: hypothetical protein WA055_00670 [Candidatus Moraniibacteriota bacterium]
MAKTPVGYSWSTAYSFSIISVFGRNYSAKKITRRGGSGGEKKKG